MAAPVVVRRVVVVSASHGGSGSENVGTTYSSKLGWLEKKKMRADPCPICKSTELGVYHDELLDTAVVACRNCGCNIQRETKKDAIEAWNRRKSNE